MTLNGESILDGLRDDCDKLKATIQKWRSASQYLKDNEPPGGHTQDYACGEVGAYKRVLDLLVELEIGQPTDDDQ